MKAGARRAVRWLIRLAALVVLIHSVIVAWGQTFASAEPVDACSTYKMGTLFYPSGCYSPGTEVANKVKPCLEAFPAADLAAKYCTSTKTLPGLPPPSGPASGPTLPNDPPLSPAAPPAAPAPGPSPDPSSPAESPGTSTPSTPPADPSASAGPSAPSGTPSGGEKKDKEHNAGVAADAGILGPLSATDPDGVPLGHYDLFADTDWDPIAKVLLFVANLFFAIARTIIGISVWILDLALSFGLLDMLRGPVESLNTALEVQIIGPLQLRDLVLTIAGVIILWLWVRGRSGKAIKEAAMTAVIAALAAVFLANPAQALMGDHGLLTTARDFSTEVGAVALGTDADPSSSTSVSGPLRDGLIEQLVVKPHQLLQYGRILDDPKNPDPCLAAYKGIVASGPWWSDNEIPLLMMEDCNEDLATYADESSLFERVMGALALLIAVCFIGPLVVTLAGGVIYVTFVLARDAVVLVFDAIRGQLPGAGRDALINRLQSLLQVFLMVVLSVFALVGFLLVVRAVLGTSGQSLMARLVVLDLAAIAMWKFRKRISMTVAKTAHNITAKLHSANQSPPQPSRWNPAAVGTGAVLGAGAGALVAAHQRAGELKGKFIVPKSDAAAPVPTSPSPGSPALQPNSLSPVVSSRPSTSPPAPAPRLRDRVAAAPAGQKIAATGRGAKKVSSLAAAAAGLGLKSTIGLPVYGPRAARTLSRVRQQRLSNAKARVRAAADAGRAGVDNARAFGREYVSGLTAAPRAIGSAGRRVAAAVRIPPPPPPTGARSARWVQPVTAPVRPWEPQVVARGRVVTLPPRTNGGNDGDVDVDD